MEVLDLCLLFLFVAARGPAQRAVSTCTATNEKTLKCMFPENINDLQKDFSLYFYSDGGSEELLVECTWIESQYYCITQAGFELRGPVSDTAVITIPTRFLDKKGSYRCTSDGYRLDGIIPCRFPEKDSKRFSTCEVQAEMESHQVVLKCVFSSDIESFSVFYNNSLVVKYTRSSCQSSTQCHNIIEDRKHVFSVRLNTSEHLHNEYLCQPDDDLFEVFACNLAMEKHAEASPAPSLATILSVVCVICLTSVGLVFAYIYRKSVRHRTVPQKMQTFCSCVILLSFIYGNGNSSAMTCALTEAYETYVCIENTYTDFNYQLTSGIIENSEQSDFRIEIKLCETGTSSTACKCLWISNNAPACKSLRNDSTCEADKSKMRISLLVKRTYTDIQWVYFKQNRAPAVLKQIELQVTYPAKITGLRVNGEAVNGTHLADENQEVNISCFFTNGNPLVSIRVLDDTGHTLNSTKHGEGRLALSLGVYQCQDVWPVIRCEAPGSESNRSVAILVRCPPQLSYMTTQVTDLRRVQEEGLNFSMKAYTSDIRKCLMTQVQSRASAREVKCDVRGHPPEFTLTVRVFNESWIREGIWTLQIMTELGASSITFQLINSTDRLPDTLWCLLPDPARHLFPMQRSSVSPVVWISIIRPATFLHTVPSYTSFRGYTW